MPCLLMPQVLGSQVLTRILIMRHLGYIISSERDCECVRSVNMLFTFIIGQCFVAMLCAMHYGVRPAVPNVGKGRRKMAVIPTNNRWWNAHSMFTAALGMTRYAPAECKQGV